MTRNISYLTAADRCFGRTCDNKDRYPLLSSSAGDTYPGDITGTVSEPTSGCLPPVAV
jgi:hypothetical protein